MISGDTNEKIFVFKNDKKALTSFLQSHKTITLVGGCFDVLHYGHISFLKNAKKLGASVVVLLEPDETIRKKKQREPIHNQDQRAHLLSALHYVDVVIMLPVFTDDQQYEEVTKLIKPTYIAVTKGDKYMEQKVSQATLTGAVIKEVTPLIEGLSTSSITKDATISGN